MIYIDGLVVPVKAGTSADAYAAFARGMVPLFKEYGARRIVEGWADDVPDGTRTDFRRAVAAEPGETVVFAWIEWPDKATRVEGMRRMMEDPRMQGPSEDQPLDGKRMIFGGFQAIVDE